MTSGADSCRRKVLLPWKLPGLCLPGQDPFPSPGEGCAGSGIAQWHCARLVYFTHCPASFAEMFSEFCRACCELSLLDSKQQMVLFTQEIRLFIFQSHRHL